MKKIILISVTIVMISLFFVGKVIVNSKKNGAKDEMLIVGTNAEYPPFTYIENNEIIGFDIDIMKEIAKRLEKKITIKDMPFDSLIPAALVGSVQIIAAGMTSTSIRENKVFFSNPYLSDDRLQIVCEKKEGNISSLKQLVGKKVVVNEGYTADLYFSSVCPDGVEIIRLNAPADGFMALKSNRANAFVTSRLTIQSFLRDTVNKDKNFLICDIDDKNAKDHYNLVISQKNPNLLNKVNKILDQMASDGTIDVIKKKWKIN